MVKNQSLAKLHKLFKIIILPIKTASNEPVNLIKTFKIQTKTTKKYKT